MICYICAQPAIGQCKTCMKFYCVAHGDQLCLQCKTRIPVGPPSSTFARMVLGHPSVGSDHPPAFQARRLTEEVPERVLGIGKTVQTGGFQIVLLSVELYRSGFVANFRLIGERPMIPMMPGLSLDEIADNIGTQYHGQELSGSGTGQMWQTAFGFSPAMPPDAKELRITVREITVMGPGMGSPASLEKGPWVFDVDMRATV